jgi:hypothetical protein
MRWCGQFCNAVGAVGLGRAKNFQYLVVIIWCFIYRLINFHIHVYRLDPKLIIGVLFFFFCFIKFLLRSSTASEGLQDLGLCRMILSTYLLFMPQP